VERLERYDESALSARVVDAGLACALARRRGSD